MQNKKYHIKSFKEVCNVVTEENISNLLIDIAHGLSIYVAAIKEIKEKNPKLIKKNNWDIIKFEFEWIDDNKNDILGVKVTNTQTGETNYYPNPNENN